MPKATFTSTIHAPFEQVRAMLADKVENPRKYIGGVLYSRILERCDSYVVREMFQPLPVPLKIREKIYDVPVPDGQDFVFEFQESPQYTGTFHNVLTHLPGREDAVSLKYVMDWHPLPGTEDPIPQETAEAMVRQGVLHLKELAEKPLQVPRWVRAFFDTADTMDATAMGALLTDDVRFRFGNGTDVIGQANVVKASGAMAEVFAGMHHNIVDVSADENGAHVECLVEYTTHGGEKYLFPFLTKLVLDGDKISTVLIFGDISPVQYGWG